MQTVKCKDDVKVITVRGTAFDACETGGNDATVEEGKKKNLIILNICEGFFYYYKC